MSNLKYKVGDKVLIKDIGWYNENKNILGNVECGDALMTFEKARFCGKIVTISSISDVTDTYGIEEDNGLWKWTDEMFERLVERNGKTYPYKIGDRVVLKGNNRCATITDLKYNSWGNLSYYIKIDNDKDISIDYPTDLLLPYDNMVEELVQEETPKFKVNDIVFVKSIGWVRITNGYWDSFANEYIYEVIGFNGEGEYDSINQSDIECQMLPESESENPHTGGNKITLEEYKNNDKEWLFNKLATLDNITALESIQDIFNHLQRPKYPKTYEECCEILGCIAGYVWGGYKGDLIKTFHMLYICRDAYWKLYGEEIGLDKPWEPDYDGTFEHGSPIKYVIYNNGTYIVKERKSSPNYILAFPTEEMRDAFYEAFKEEIEICKELL